MAGELSGDRAASRVVAELQKQSLCHTFGLGGSYLRKTGVDLVSDVGSLASIGLAEGLRLGLKWARTWVKLQESILRHQPKVALLVDSPELNLPLARILTERGTKVVYYIGPQVWAWRSARLGLLGRRTDVMALILPFEKQLYEQAGVRAEFVGHPLLDEVRARSGRAVRAALNLGPKDRVIALLPGSRNGEIRRHIEPMLSMCEKLSLHPHTRGIVPVIAPPPGQGRESVPGNPKRHGVRFLPETFSSRDLLGASDAALVASGTATLEATLEGIPHGILYKIDTPSYLLAKHLLKIPYIGLPNWIAGREIVPERVQGEVEADALFELTLEILKPEEQRRQKKELFQVARSLGSKGVAGRVAELVLERL